MIHHQFFHHLSLVLIFSLLLSSPVAAAVTLEGKQIQGGLLVGQTDPGALVKLDEESVRVSPDGVFLLGFGRDHRKESRLQITYADGGKEQQLLTVGRREYQIQRIDGLPKRKVTPQKLDLKRIRKETAMTKSARRLDDARTDFLGGWIWPVTGRISGVYGSQRILNGEARRPHFGVDIAMPAGTPVKAPADGVVTMAHPDMFFSGGTLIVDHGHNLSSSFLHLSRILVEKGERVRQGDIIAEVGATGRVTGAHLDWRMNYHKHRLDPQLLVPPMPK
ncbi:MAG: M23 family metallopeptidase [Candidatus Sedimenticola sp. (ex Thyasira tokunagai)]